MLDAPQPPSLLQFKKLRLAGFKSFVEPAELLIEPGLTGVVGPNGCGKSNLVEALKWAMGETSAKQMRGSGMEDVIFNGASNRPARNMAEVTLVLDNTGRVAPPALNAMDELEVTRRIERERGSNYRINGQDVRARDVQLLFADQATGARSTALVSQGRIGAVIGAKPEQRRVLLEEAAGITGLHSRRHEAELRLKNAETNLERLEDLLQALETQMKGLERQARQAARYRGLSDTIRTTEATLFALRWRLADAALAASRAQLGDADAAVQHLTAESAKASTAQAGAAEGLPALRQEEAEKAAALQRLTLERESLEREEAAARERAADVRRRIEEGERDRQREEALRSDAAAADARLSEERSGLEDAQKGEAAALEDATAAVAEISSLVAEREDALATLTEQAAARDARDEALRRREQELARRAEALGRRREAAESEKAQLEDRHAADFGALEDAQATLDNANARHEQARAALEEKTSLRTDAADAARTSADAYRTAATAFAAAEAEVRALRNVLKNDGCSDLPPVLDQVSAAPGYEIALGAALGEDLNVPADPAAGVHWRNLGPAGEGPALPEGAEPLSAHVTAPASLAKRLAQIGVVASADQGAALQTALATGQRLVSRAGGLWRWDGYTAAEGSETAAGRRLAEQNRLKGLEADLETSRASHDQAKDAADQAGQRRQAAIDAEAEAKREAASAEQALSQAGRALAQLKERSGAAASRMDVLGETLATLASELEETARTQTQAREERAGLEDGLTARTEIERRRVELAECRAEQVEAQGRLGELKRAEAARRDRLLRIADEARHWARQRETAAARLSELTARDEALKAELAGLEGQPAKIAERRDALLGALENAETARQAAADRLALAETALRDAEAGSKAAERALADAREIRARAEGAVEQAAQACQDLKERIRERLQVAPEALREMAGLKEGMKEPELEAVERKLDRLLRERDTMGPVNLRAEQEITELSEQIEGLGRERDDLIEAIAKLRQGISTLNREGRQRLLASFEEVNGHFQKLFVRLFGGGEAHLALTEGADPLEAGLEIYASPPGKKLQAMSLLSGGEQALTALALLFAVFQTNPAPICVLDEVDAPLDDANVDRFCTLLEHMAATGQTRFLIITHHRMTMARMHRLFGVTMQERGVSQLVSVDLQRAEELRATA